MKRVALLVLLSIVVIEACELRHGCKIKSGACTCALGCRTEYPYISHSVCRNALKERGTNVCSRLPCYNAGTCIQVIAEPGFKCRCEGTGYYGTRCEIACTVKDKRGNIPFECIEI